jgi:hypothetical protein
MVLMNDVVKQCVAQLAAEEEGLIRFAIANCRPGFRVERRVWPHKTEVVYRKNETTRAEIHWMLKLRSLLAKLTKQIEEMGKCKQAKMYRQRKIN